LLLWLRCSHSSLAPSTVIAEESSAQRVGLTTFGRMDLPNVIMTLLVGMFLALVTPSILRQRERIWGPGQKARIERAKALAGRPPELVTWAVREALIIIWLVII